VPAGTKDGARRMARSRLKAELMAEGRLVQNEAGYRVVLD
jgi:hypothetical protein